MKFQKKVLKQEGDFFVCRDLYFWGVDFQTFHLQICFSLNASMQCPLRSKVSPLCPQPPRGPCLKSADLSDKNFGKEFVPEGREGVFNSSGKILQHSFRP